MSGRPAYLVSEPSPWTGCYDSGWQGEIVPEAFAHPAKVSRALIRRIYEHAFAEGWLRAGDVVADPFGGIAGTALDAMWNGCHWIGCELEPRFVGLAQQNIDLWRRKYGSKPGFGSARILQGDSRQLASVIAGADLVCSSPPFLEQEKFQDNRSSIRKDVAFKAGASTFTDYGQSPGQLGAMKEGEPPTVDLVCSSPPYAAIATGAGGLNTKPGKDGQQSGRNPDSASQDTDQRYGESAGQLATMREGEAPACIVSSPPYTGAALGHTRGPAGDVREATGKYKQGYTQGAIVDTAYGSTPGQLESMPEGRFDAVVSSPPFEAIEGANSANKFKDPVGSAKRRSEGYASGRLKGHFASEEAIIRSMEKANAQIYGEADGNIGNQTGDTFWQAAREIVAQCHAILRPGGHAIWICKDFVRKGKRVPFSDQWQALCEQEGFRLVCRHRAMLVAHHGEQDALFGATEQLTTARKSFFRRLAEAKGSPAIDWEDVICLQKEVSA